MPLDPADPDPPGSGPPKPFEVVFSEDPPPPPPSGTKVTWYLDLRNRVLALFRDPPRAFIPPAHLALWLVPILLFAAADLGRSLALRDLVMQQAEVAALEMDIPEEMRDQALALTERSGEWVATPQAIIGLAVAWLANAFFFCFGTAGLFFAALNFVLGGRARYLDVVMVVGLSGLIAVLRTTLLTPIMRMQQSLEVSASPALFFSVESGLVYKIARLFDVFDLYRIFLLTVGFAVVARVPWSRSAALVVGFWALWALLALRIGS